MLVHEIKRFCQIQGGLKLQSVTPGLNKHNQPTTMDRETLYLLATINNYSLRSYILTSFSTLICYLNKAGLILKDMYKLSEQTWKHGIVFSTGLLHV